MTRACQIGDGCTNPAYHVCRALLCCKDYGCGKVMCTEHQGRKCVGNHGETKKRSGTPQYTCINCNDAAHKASIVACVVPFSIFCIIVIIMFTVFGMLVKNSMDDHEEFKSRNFR